MSLYKIIFFSLFVFAGMYCSAAGNRFETKPIGAAQDSLPISCSKSDEIEKIISDAISLGAPIYNEGLHMACYRIYEWAAYKIIYVYTPICKNVGTILKKAIDESHGDYSDTEKAWLMRQAFDKILGVPTQLTQPEKESLLKNG